MHFRIVERLPCHVVTAVACAGVLSLAACDNGGEPPPIATIASAPDSTRSPPTATAPVTTPPDGAPEPSSSVSPTSSAGPVGRATAEPEAPVAIAASAVVGDLDRPWDLAFAPDGRIFITEQDSGRLLELSRGEVAEVQRFTVEAGGEGGLLGIAVAPDYADSGLLYAYLSTPQDNRVVRFRPGAEAEAVVTGIPHASIHNGGRIAFGPDDHLYIGTGDAGQAQLAQDPNSLAGKILRAAPDGSVPADNPDDSLVYSLGHRNVQGLAWDTEGRLYASELGPDADDEINRIVAGGNYGWPDVTGMADNEAYIDPLYVRQPAVASWSGIAFGAQPVIPQWTGDLLVASLRGQRLWHLELDGDGGLTEAGDLFAGTYGRLRTAVFAPDGSLWLVTSNTDIYGDRRAGDDRIIRLAPEQ